MEREEVNIQAEDKTGSRVLGALLVALFIFVVAILLPKLLFTRLIPRLVTTQGLELILSLLAIMVFGRGRFAAYGFCRPNTHKAPDAKPFRWLPLSLIAPVFGIVATPLILGFGGGGNPLLKELGFPQMILFVWVFSSIIEEIFTRGFVQGHVANLSGRYFSFSFINMEWPVLISALVFASMHFVLLVSGVDAVTMTVTFLFTLSIGLLAGYVRQKTGSLIPAITVHIFANIGGAIGGVIYMLARFAITGQFPGS
jgi:membrane protease YdiL (CAAX protease family)